MVSAPTSANEWIQWAEKKLEESWRPHVTEWTWYGQHRVFIEIVHSIENIEPQREELVSTERVDCPSGWPAECVCTRTTTLADYDITVKFVIFRSAVFAPGHSLAGSVYRLEKLGEVTWTFGIFGELRSAVAIECPGLFDLPKLPGNLASLPPGDALVALAAREPLAALTVPGWIGESAMRQWVPRDIAVYQEEETGGRRLGVGYFEEVVVKLPAMQQAEYDTLVKAITPLIGDALAQLAEKSKAFRR